MKYKNQRKMNIDMGALVKAMVGEMEEKTRKGRISRMRKFVVGFYQALVGNNNILVQ